jgi:hypothetical protein
VQFEENQFGRLEIPSVRLTLAHVPCANGVYSSEIVEFALTFDGYARHPNTVFKISYQSLPSFTL